MALSSAMNGDRAADEREPTMTTDQRIESILRARATSFWLKDALRTALQRDPLDAAGDVAELLIILRARANDLLTQHR